MTRRQLLLIAFIAIAIAVFVGFDLGRFTTLAEVKSRQGEFLAMVRERPVFSAVIFSLVYVVAAALSLPGAAVILTLLAGALFGLVAAGVFSAGEQVVGAAPIRWSLPVAGALLYVSLGASIAAYRCWGLGVAEGGPALAAFFSNLTPLFTALLSASLLGEAPQPFHALAFALIVGGSIVIPHLRRGIEFLDQARGHQATRK
jgi:drug/metabolite transporter (DMT)-like permease